ncbi:hypothetical protein GGR55DRAFT_684321 [Xylaria sp. FL0064]|nr:hypothetical protein GGR55DRAFT_684321 [Xylaria sp. FL0064]
MTIKDKQTAQWDGLVLPGPDTCTFVDEMERAQTFGSQTHYFSRKPDGTLVPTHLALIVAAVCVTSGPGLLPSEPPKKTVSSGAAAQARTTTSSARKHYMKRDDWHASSVATCGSWQWMSLRRVANAFLPPLMLVNHEAHKIASKHHRRAFRSLSGQRGALAAYPIILQIEAEVLDLLPLDDFELVAELELTDTDRWGWDVPLESERSEKVGKILAAPNLKKVGVKFGHYGRVATFLVDYALPSVRLFTTLPRPFRTDMCPRSNSRLHNFIKMG